jgi:hypothetical protein
MINGATIQSDSTLKGFCGSGGMGSICGGLELEEE